MKSLAGFPGSTRAGTSAMNRVIETPGDETGVIASRNDRSGTSPITIGVVTSIDWTTDFGGSR
ncbi:hypothetical protein ACWGR4_39230 [Embleya sp. NPDC055664]